MNENEIRAIIELWLHGLGVVQAEPLTVIPESQIRPMPPGRPAEPVHTKGKWTVEVKVAHGVDTDQLADALAARVSEGLRVDDSLAMDEQTVLLRVTEIGTNP
jgi:hypothetical protein